MTAPRVLALALGLAAFACGNAHADRPLAPPHHPDRAALPLAESPYSIDVVDESGRSLPTYQAGDRFYVLGSPGARYSLRVSNPTSRRVEAVLSVDGLDVIDGEGASFRKRGYVIPAGGSVVVDGYRTSTTQVAAFRFSSVAGSYAGRKGVARNVGVIGVAIFAERGEPVMVLPETRFQGGSIGGGSGLDDGYRGGAAADEGAPSRKESRPAPQHDVEASVGAAGQPAPTRSAPSRRVTRTESTPPTHRPGLGTAFGERRYSAVSWTRFERAHPTVPTAIAELRYNDADGLRALGIRLGPVVGEHELTTRETASPFPGEDFARPPR